jgi:hypothetical protein
MVGILRNGMGCGEEVTVPAERDFVAPQLTVRVVQPSIDF